MKQNNKEAKSIFPDVLGAAKGWAASVLHNETLREQFKSFYRRPDTFSFGVCNGCQLMCLINWVGNAGKLHNNIIYFEEKSDF